MKFRASKSPFTPAGLDRMKYKGERLEVSEPGGLRIVIGARSKTFMFRYKSPATGKQRNMSLGHFPEMKLKEARTRVADAKELLLEKVDPGDIALDQKRELADSPTLDAVIEDYLTRVASKKKSFKEAKRYLEKKLSPKLGKLKIHAIKRRHVVKLIDEAAETAPVAARNLLVYCRLVFSHALERGLLQANPCSEIKPPATAKARQRILDDTEILKFWTGVNALQTSQDIKDILHLCLVTGQRSGEIRQMKWEDLNGSWWTIPEGVAKNKLAHRVPLTPLVQEILEAARSRREDSDFVFPGKNSGQPLGRNSPDQALRRGSEDLQLDDFTVHDLRRTAASNMAGLGAPRLVVGMVLNHAERGVTAVYDRHSYDAEKLDALTRWDFRLQVILGLRKPSDLSPQEVVLAKIREQMEAAAAEVEDGAGELQVTLDADDWALCLEILEGAAHQAKQL